MSLVEGPDGRPRCSWGTSTPDYLAYHDEEWGRPVLDDRGVYERLCLEAFQSGLSWLTIVRNRAKIEATIANGKAVAGMATEGESLAQLMWSFAPARSAAPTSFDDLASTTPESKAFAKELKGRGFRFIGPTTAYAAMQACGVVNDHLAGCAVRETVEA